MNRAELLERLTTLKPWLAAEGISRVRLFGSHARNEAGPDSDIDLLVELSRPLGLQFFALEAALSERLGRKVDLVTAEDLHRIVRRRALAEAVDA